MTTSNERFGSKPPTLLIQPVKRDRPKLRRLASPIQQLKNPSDGSTPPGSAVIKSDPPTIGFTERNSYLTSPRPVEINNPEADKYRKMWATDDYRGFSPGEQIAVEFLSHARPKPGETVIDFGCGTGRGALMMAIMGKVKVVMVDFVDNCLDAEIHEALTTQADVLSFVKADLEHPLTVSANYGFCTDVMEHIPEDKVDAVLGNILRAAHSVFFMISTQEDSCGMLIGETLHLTIKPFTWWLEKFRELDAMIYYSQERNGDAVFYVSAWQNATKLVDIGVINTHADVINKHIELAAARGVTEVVPHARQDTIVMLGAGGPSLSLFWDEIVERRKNGELLVTTNGVYNEAIKRGLNPSAQIVLDAREHNVRFVQPIVPNCKYLLASQCPPGIFDAVPPEQTYLWHSAISEEASARIEEVYSKMNKPWYPVPGGSTVILRALSLLRILGFWRFEIFGFDSCLGDDESHHAYSQSENDGDPVVKVRCGNRIFKCHPWMASQAQEFIDQVQMMGDEIEMIVHGDGLIAHILTTGAQIEPLNEEK